jgi:hypothetical protein
LCPLSDEIDTTFLVFCIWLQGGQLPTSRSLYHNKQAFFVSLSNFAPVKVIIAFIISPIDDIIAHNMEPRV